MEQSVLAASKNKVRPCKDCDVPVVLVQGTVLGCVAINASTWTFNEREYDPRKHRAHWKTCAADRAGRVARVIERVINPRKARQCTAVR